MTFPTARRRLGVALLVSGGLVLAACTPKARIGDVLASPRTYDGRKVTLSGEARGSTSLMVFKFFKLRDDSGEIAVVTHRAVPAEGERVTVTGTVHQAFALAGQTLTVLVEDEQN